MVTVPHFCDISNGLYLLIFCLWVSASANNNLQYCRRGGCCMFWGCFDILVIFCVCPLGSVAFPFFPGDMHIWSTSPSASVFKAAARAHHRWIVSSAEWLPRSPRGKSQSSGLQMLCSGAYLWRFWNCELFLWGPFFFHWRACLLHAQLFFFSLTRNCCLLSVFVLLIKRNVTQSRCLCRSSVIQVIVVQVSISLSDWTC